MKRKGQRHDIAAVREYLVSKHASGTLKYALELDDDAQVARSRRYIEGIRAGKAVRVDWWELPEGCFPRGGHNPSDAVIVDDDDIRWAPPRDAHLPAPAP